LDRSQELGESEPRKFREINRKKALLVQNTWTQAMERKSKRTKVVEGS